MMGSGFECKDGDEQQMMLKSKKDTAGGWSKPLESRNNPGLM